MNVSEFLQLVEIPATLVKWSSGKMVKWLTTRLLNDSTTQPIRAKPLSSKQVIHPKNVGST